MWNDIFVDYWLAWVILALIIFGYRGRRKKEEPAPVPVLQRTAATGYHDNSPRSPRATTAPYVPPHRDEEPAEDSIVDLIEDLIPERDDEEVRRDRRDTERRRDSGGDDGGATMLHLQTIDTGGSRRASVHDNHRTDRKDDKDDIPAGRDAGGSGGRDDDDGDSGSDGGDGGGD